MKDPKKDEKKEAKEKEKKDVTLQVRLISAPKICCHNICLRNCFKVVLLYDPLAAPVEKDSKKKAELAGCPNPSGWTKTVKYVSCRFLVFILFISLSVRYVVDFPSPSLLATQ